MTQQALREHLFYLINKYVPESNRSDFFESILKDDVPVKGILADLNRVKDVTMDEKDGDLLREIYFFFAKKRQRSCVSATYFFIDVLERNRLHDDDRIPHQHQVSDGRLSGPAATEAGSF